MRIANITHRPRIERLETRQLLSAPALDDTFGNHGFFNLPQASFPEAALDSAELNVIEPHGKMYVASELKIRRRLAGGGADRTYGQNGTAVVPMFIGTICLQNDGKLIVAGDQSDGNDTFHLVVSRLTTSGQLDPTFGNNGSYSFTKRSNTGADGIAMRAGKIVISGYKNGDARESRPILIVLNLDGTPDTHFANNGALVFKRKPEEATTVAIDKDGFITVELDLTADLGGFRLARVTPRGKFDNRFSEDGISSLVELTATGVFTNRDGSLIVAGLDDTRKTTVLTRITNGGNVDHSFGNAGFEDINSPYFLNAGAVESPDGARYLFGPFGAFPPVSSDPVHVFVARLTATGALDTSFGDHGFFYVSTHYEDDPTDAAFVPQGNKLVITADYKNSDGGEALSELIRVLI